MPSCSIATMFATVPYLVSPVTWRGRSFHRNARPPEQVERRLVLLHLGRRDQGGEDDPGAAAIDDVVVLVAQVRAACPRSGIGVASGSVVLTRKSAVRR